ncbi:MFS transporter [Kitasatospora sp. GP82]|uniref:MFS transporter n=1 Tax=Kitasatospora sp. GP82 TaxID=3035089 RepID=UPI002472F71D|nr:MFS transporter [Kitasatospora sp. GP82]MDH6124005.1 MFS family permease [Kitasatospora sp. GP82]
MVQVSVEPAVTEKRRGRWGLWAEADFRRLWIGETTSGLGTAVGGVSLSLVAVVVLKASPVMMGVLTAVTWLPWLFIGPPAGAWVDRWPRRTVMLVSDLALMLLCELVVAPFILLLPLAGQRLPLAVSVVGWAVAVCGVVAGNVISGSFYQSYCPPELIGRIRASASTVNYSAIPIGALLGGYLGQTLGSRDTIWIMSGVLLCAGLLLLASPIRALRNFPQRA